jgi:hypothetical protein
LDGERCPHWAMASEESGGLCWLHAFPHQHGQIKHSYYRRVPYFSPVEHTVIRDALQEDEPLSPELLIVRFKLRRVLAYTGRSDISALDMDRAAYVSYRGVRAVSRLLRAQKKSREIEWGPTAAGYTPQLRDQILKIYPAPPEEDDPHPQ